MITSIVIEAGQPQVLFQTAISPQKGGLKTIYTASVSSHAALNTSATINNSLAPSTVLDQNYIRSGDALGTLPFVTRSTSSSMGDDESISLRGFDPTESAVLLDGHPLGPIGAHGTSYDFQLGTFFGFNNINVIYGSGATGLYGVPVLGGAVDFQTIDPTPKTHVSFTQGYGDFGKTLSGGTLTGTAGNLGYAFAYAVAGTDGVLGPENILQSGDLANGGLVSRCPGSPTAAAYPNGAPPTLLPGDVAACNYEVDGNYINRNGIAKLVYKLDSKTQISATIYNASMYADSQGNGDTDYVPQPWELFEANNALSNGNNNFQLANGNMTACSSTTLAALYNNAQGYECLTAKQYANAFSGPQGGGLGRFHAAQNQDYHLRLTRRIGAGQLVLDGFIDNYNFVNVKGPLPANAYQDTFFTHGGVISDEYAGRFHDLSFGVDFLHQQHGFNSDLSPAFGPPNTSLFITENSYFIHDTYTPNERLSVFADISAERSFNTATTNLDPRLSVVLRPTRSDVFRVTYGRATSEPDPSLVNGGFSYNTLPQNDPSFNPQQNCGQPLVSLGSGSNPLVKPEQSNDVEVALAHCFQNQAVAEVDAYESHETNPILGAVFPFSDFPASDAPSSALVDAYSNALTQACGSQYTAANFGLSSSFNAGGAVYKGIVVQTKIPIVRHFSFDGNYTVQSAYYTGLSNNILATNTGLVPNQQLTGIPLQTAGAGLDYTNAPGEFRVRIDGYYTATNNGFNRPRFYYANGNLTKTVGPITFNLGVNNIFNSNSSPYGLIGYGLPPVQNSFGTPGLTAFDVGSEEYGLTPRQVELTTTIKF